MEVRIIGEGNTRKPQNCRQVNDKLYYIMLYRLQLDMSRKNKLVIVDREIGYSRPEIGYSRPEIGYSRPEIGVYTEIVDTSQII